MTTSMLFGGMGCQVSSSNSYPVILEEKRNSSIDFQKGFDAAENGDYATAVRIWTPLAELADPISQTFLGMMYYKGQGVPQDDTVAVNWYTLAAEQGYVVAQTNLGVMYENGKGVPQNYKTAVKWYRFAAEQGLADAQSKLGEMYYLGKGVIHNNIYAYMWAKNGASNGSAYGRMLRDFIAKQMTPDNLSEAQKLSRECNRKKYKGC